MRLRKFSYLSTPSPSCERSSRMQTSSAPEETSTPPVSTDLMSREPLLPKLILSIPLSTVTASEVSSTLMPSGESAAALAAFLESFADRTFSESPSVRPGVRELARPIHFTEPSIWRAMTHCCSGRVFPAPSVSTSVCPSLNSPLPKGTPQLCPAGTSGSLPVHCSSMSCASDMAEAARAAAMMVNNLVIRSVN